MQAAKVNTAKANNTNFFMIFPFVLSMEPIILVQIFLTYLRLTVKAKRKKSLTSSYKNPELPGLLIADLNLFPIQDDLAGITGTHCFETQFKIIDFETMRNDIGHIQSAFDHSAHFIPSFKHFTTINSFEE